MTNEKTNLALTVEGITPEEGQKITEGESSFKEEIENLDRDIGEFLSEIYRIIKDKKIPQSKINGFDKKVKKYTDELEGALKKNDYSSETLEKIKRYQDFLIKKVEEFEGMKEGEEQAGLATQDSPGEAKEKKQNEEGVFKNGALEEGLKKIDTLILRKGMGSEPKKAEPVSEQKPSEIENKEEKEKASENAQPDIEKKLYNAYLRGDKKENQQKTVSGLKNELFEILKKGNFGGDRKIGGEVLKIDERIKAEAKEAIKQKKDEQLDKRKETEENFEKIKQETETVYKSFWEDYLNQGKETPKELSDKMLQLGKELYDAWPGWKIDKQHGRQWQVSDFIYELKTKYKKAGLEAQASLPPKEREKPAVKREGKEKSISEEEIKILAEQIKKWRIEGKRTGYTWKEIDKILANRGLAPGTPAADKFMDDWDFKKAKEILEAESKKEVLPKPPRSEKRAAAKIKPKEEESRGGEKKEELSPEVFNLLKSAKEEFSQELEKQATTMEGWGKYSAEEKKALLQIEVKVFLRDLVEKEIVSRDLASREGAEKIIEKLIKEKEA